MDFQRILDAFTDCVEKGDAERFSELFTEDGVYVDGFYGAFAGRAAIADMLANHFHGAAKNFKWIMRRPVRVGEVGYANYLFSYESTMPESNGKKVMFEGTSQFLFEGDKIRRYSEIFDRGVALVQLGFPSERIGKSLARWTREFVEANL